MSSPSTPPSTRTLPGPLWTSWRTNGGSGIRRSSGYGTTAGRSSFPSWTTEPVAKWCPRWRVDGELASRWSDDGCPVDLEEVEGCGGQVEFAGRGVQAAAGESVDDLL